MKRIAIMNGNVVENVASWDGVSPWNPGKETIELVDNERCGPGWILDERYSPRFSPPQDE